MKGLAPAPPVPIPEGPVVGKSIHEPPRNEEIVKPAIVEVASVDVPVTENLVETERLVVEAFCTKRAFTVPDAAEKAVVEAVVI
jgi:hypothetical protein